MKIAISGNNAIAKAEDIMEEYLPNVLIAASENVIQSLFA